MGNCLSSNPHADAGAQAGLVKAAPDQLVKAVDTPAPIKPAAAKEQPSEVIDLDSVVANVVSNPDTDLILNMIDPVNGPAAGLPYQVHYLGPPRPPCEKERLATVHALGKISDAAKPDPEIATILKLVAGVFKCPAALCALFDEKQVFISEQEGNVIPCGEFPWRWTLCGWSMAFKNPQVLVIQDTLEDARFANNLKVTKAPHVRFYCGAPLVASNGQRLGTLCFADVKPRKFDQASCVMMNNLSELVVRQLEKDIALKLKEKDNKALKETYKNLQRAVDCYEHSVVLLDTSEKGWKIVYANASWTKQTGLPREKLIGSLLCDVLEATDGTQLPSLEMTEACKRAKDTKVKMARIKDPSVTKTVSLSFKPAGRHLIDDTTIPIGVPGFLDLDDKEEDVAHRFFFMTVHTPGQRRGSQVSSCYLSPCGMSPSLSGSISSDGTERSVVAGLELAHLLGRGSFGWVYYATWYGTPVAVKVIDEDIRRPVDTDGARDPQDGPHQEAVMAHELRHPNIVATLKYATHSIPRGRAPALCDYLNTNNELNEMDTHNSSFSKGTTPPRTASTPARSKEPSAAEVAPAGDSRWAVIEAPPDSQWEAESNHGSEDEKADARVLKALQVKADGWMMEEHSAHTKFNRPSIDHPSSALASSANNNTAASSTLMQTWMVMEYCDKGCVQDAVDRGWLRDMRDCLASKANMVAVIATAHEIASAMQYLHAHDIVHGDLSGWNVMLSSTGSTSAVGGRGWTAKVADFGLSRSMDMQTRITTRNYGTITHMPPELLVAGTMSKAVDVWSFGVLLWQMYTGSRPWSGLTHAQIILKVAQQKQRLHWDDHTPAAYKDLAESCMAFDMDKRPTFAAIVQTLDEMKHTSGY